MVRSKCSAVKRGKLAGLEGDMLTRVSPFSLTFKASNLEELTLATVIDKVCSHAMYVSEAVGVVRYTLHVCMIYLVALEMHGLYHYLYRPLCDYG